MACLEQTHREASRASAKLYATACDRPTFSVSFLEGVSTMRPKNFLQIAAVALPVVLGTTWCAAQSYFDSYGGYGGCPWGDSRATTPRQGWAYGIGDIIRSEGTYNLLSSQAAINMTTAVRNDIENRELWANTYFQLRHGQRAAIAQERGPIPSAEDLVRYAAMGRPRPLGPNQLDAASGKIYWPRSLRTQQFAFSRGILEEIFVKRARYGDISMDDLLKVRDETNRMIDRLNGQIRDIPPMEYVAAKQFLSSLAYQVQSVASWDAVAATVPVDVSAEVLP